MKNLFIVLLSVVAFASVGCEKAEAPKTVEPSTTEQPGEPQNGDEAEEQAHAPAGYVPGSHEDWCGGHGVPESMCTRCNPTLIAGFKATGDWCEEHKLPKSQCLACDPDLKIERPPKKAN